MLKTRLNHNLNNFQNAQEKLSSIKQWLSAFAPTHFFTIQFHFRDKTDDLEKSNHKLKELMMAFEHNLLGCRWHKKHYPFVAMAEKTDQGFWHYHLLLKITGRTEQDLNLAVQKMMLYYGLSEQNLFLEPIMLLENVITYSTKQLYIKPNGQMSSDRIITSADLFNLGRNSVYKQEEDFPKLTF